MKNVIKVVEVGDKCEGPLLGLLQFTVQEVVIVKGCLPSHYDVSNSWFSAPFVQETLFIFEISRKYLAFTIKALSTMVEELSQTNECNLIVCFVL